MPTVSTKPVVIIRMLLYIFITISSFVIFVPVSISMVKSSGECLLYSKRVNVHILYGPDSNCVYVVATSVILNLGFGLVLTGAGISNLIGKLNPLSDLIGLGFLINVIGDVVACFLIFVAGCILSVGFKQVCDDTTGGIYDCSAVVVGADRYSFYDHFSTAQAALWVSFVLWLAQVGVGIVTLWRLGKLCCNPVASAT